MAMKDEQTIERIEETLADHSPHLLAKKELAASSAKLLYFDLIERLNGILKEHKGDDDNE